MPSIVSLFSGCGGLDLGFEREGFEPIVAYDASESAILTYNSNRNREIGLVSDLVKIDPAQIIRKIHETNQVPIGVIGGPPCQAFSRGNVNPKDNDIRRMLPGRFAEILRELTKTFPIHFFVFENVNGITYSRHEEEFARFRKLFEECGFKLFESMLDAKKYGVPQSRERVFIVGLNQRSLHDVEFSFPIPQTADPLTLRQAFEDVFGERPWPEPLFYRTNLVDEDFTFHRNHWTMNPKSKKFKNGYLLRNPRTGRSFRRLEWDEPSLTVAYGNREIHVHPCGTRRLSILEAMILQGFPFEYVLQGNLSQQVKMVSDAVPPPLAQAVASALREVLVAQQLI